jgi:hypothetical protein
MQIDIETFSQSRTTQGIKVPSSLDLADLEKVIAMVRGQWMDAHGGMLPADDVIRVTADDEHIAIHWTDEESE